MAKSELILAFNEIAETRKLPREVIIDALKAALVSAYRRNSSVSSAQHVEARIDERTGDIGIWIEKEVVEDIQTDQTEVLIEEAHKIDPDAVLGETILVEDTPEDFGRIAAQTAKQVILQRMREAEREAQYQEYQDRVGDLVTGTVQSDTGDVVTIGLGRTEAILPRSQQQPGERYRMHDKVRAYVMEVRRSSRGPQIVVSRTHKNMLRRLLEYEVPEIYNGSVEIKSIAREPGARSKVAVAALQPGADPVGACVGMRGVRIQSIVKELNGEKIDVIEWSPDQAEFISKALSPARVSSVFLDDDPSGGRTATVVVPDDQLSLAIGREGQNARLAAKLTGWRIDIKSVTEAAEDVYGLLETDEQLAAVVAERPELVEQVGITLAKRAESKPIMPEEYTSMVEFVKMVESYRSAERDALREEQQARQDAARELVPVGAYEYPLEETDLPLRVYNVLDEAGYTTVGQVIEQYYYDPEKLSGISGFGPAALEEVEKMIDTIEIIPPEPEEVVEEVVEAEASAEPEGEAVSEEAPEQAVAEVAEGQEGEPTPGIQYLSEEEIERRRRAELIARMTPLIAPEEEEQLQEAVEPATQEEPVVPVAEAVEEEFTEEAAPEVEAEAELEFVDGEEDEETIRRRAKQLRRRLVFDEELGRVVSKRQRKRSSEDWEDEWEE